MARHCWQAFDMFIDDKRRRWDIFCCEDDDAASRGAISAYASRQRAALDATKDFRRRAGNLLDAALL